MHGVGIKMAATTPDQDIRLLDLSRLVSRAGRRSTGIDRVELAYLKRFLKDEAPSYGLVKSSAGYLLLSKTGMTRLWDAFQNSDWGRSDFLSRRSWRGNPERQALEAEMRRHAIARCVPQLLSRTLRKNFAPGVRYFNVGHSNLSLRVLRALKSAEASISVMLHDALPLDHPEMQAPGSVERFQGIIKRVSEIADLVIYPSCHSQDRLEHHFSLLGTVPKGVVARLGVEMPETTGAKLPKDLPPPGPFFMILGTIEPRKNHLFLLELWEDMARENFDPMPSLLICGARGWDNGELFDRLDATTLRNSVIRELSDLGDAEISQLLKKSAGLLFPSVSEGVGLPPVEAFLLECPVVCNDLPSCREYLGDQVDYRSVNHPYLWKDDIKRLCNVWGSAESECRSTKQEIFELSWDSHFRTTLMSV